MCSDVAIRIRGLSKTFPVYRKPHHRLFQLLDPRHGNRWHRDFQALRELDLDIHRGETDGIVGRHGPGKSQFLQLVCGPLAPSTGEITDNGGDAAMAELGPGFNTEMRGHETTDT